jgi:hypothetical protein
MLAAIVVGVWTALYLGLRAGAIAAVATAAALLVAAVLPIPGVSIAVYMLVIGWCATLYFVLPKMAKPGGKATGPTAASAATIAAQVGTAWSWAKKKLQR